MPLFVAKALPHVSLAGVLRDHAQERLAVLSSAPFSARTGSPRITYIPRVKYSSAHLKEKS